MANQAVWRAEATRFRVWAEFADEYTTPPHDGGPVLAGTERMLQWGGDGTPLVAEFCVLEVAAALRLDEHQVRCQIGDALAVRHRLPGVWQAVMAGRFRVWAAVDLADAIRSLPYGEALQLDGEITPLLMVWSRRRLLKYVKGRVTDLHPQQAETRHEELKKQCGVVFEEPVAGFTRVFATLPAGEAVALKARIQQLAVILGKCPRDPDAPLESLEFRQAQALGLLASPAYTLQLLQAEVADRLPTLDPSCPMAGWAGHECGTITTDPAKLLPTVEVVVHLTDQVLRDGAGVARSEQVGPLLAGWVKTLVGHSRVKVRPVLDAGNQVPVDSYECPPNMRRAVELRNPYEVFPFSSRLSPGLDLDHTTPWTPTRGLTRADNLGPLSRRVHRAKTHGGWHLEQLHPGVFIWTSPLGFSYLVTPTGSWMINDPTTHITALAG
ncbi:DUF222 domain-containing protein [Aestuariimicrobium sp. Y1814]|uniref:DUF222 domain-containing protein n=1 Tax=Aestuariimicrobium sp. Y1814 TaxID=3418742 RepID=UPI003D39E2CE